MAYVQRPAGIRVGNGQEKLRLRGVRVGLEDPSILPAFLPLRLYAAEKF